MLRAGHTFGGPCFWDMLPEDLKGHILGMLNNRDLSRVAHTCSDFAGRAKTSRTTARHISIPTGKDGQLPMPHAHA